MDIKFRDRLSYRQTKRTVIVALLLGIILSMAQIFDYFIVEKRSMDATVSQVVEMLKEPASMAAYNRDAEQARNVLRGLFEYQAICKTTIVDEYVEILGNKERPLTIGSLNFIDHMLNKMDHRVIVADSSQSAIEQLQEIPVDMVLMDVQMPLMDGLAATRRIRDNPSEIRNIPIIAITANAMKGDREKCLDAGMNDYISKPFYPQKLTELITRWDLKHKLTDMK